MKSETFGNDLIKTFRQIGFVILKNHGLSKEKIDEAFTRARSFFSLEKEEKRKIVFEPALNRGFMGSG